MITMSAVSLYKEKEVIFLTLHFFGVWRKSSWVKTFLFYFISFYFILFYFILFIFFFLPTLNFLHPFETNGVNERNF